jgi:hypothetical protein
MVLKNRGPYHVLAGGDTDITAAILGGIIGVCVEIQGIPAKWIDGIWEWPRTVEWMERLSIALNNTMEGQTVSPPSYFIPGFLVRNLIFLTIVLVHGLRRLSPP